MAILTHNITCQLLKPFPEAVWHLPNNNNQVYFTFDDGPDPEITPQVLEILNSYGVTATFFLLGERIWNHRRELKSIDYQHHGLANHGYHHIPHILRKQNWYGNGLFLTDQLLQKKFGTTSPWFRPPFGIWSPGLRRQLEISNKILTIWSLIAFDFRWDSEKVLKHLKNKVRSGDIIVFHDNAKSRETVTTVLPPFIEYCQKQKLTISKLPDNLADL
jgi:peptidoglycan/xylan/chitin deacetylase (PgdA/CDA1 family)